MSFTSCISFPAWAFLTSSDFYQPGCVASLLLTPRPDAGSPSSHAQPSGSISSHLPHLLPGPPRGSPPRQSPRLPERRLPGTPVFPQKLTQVCLPKTDVPHFSDGFPLCSSCLPGGMSWGAGEESVGSQPQGHGKCKSQQGGGLEAALYVGSWSPQSSR